MEGQRYTTWDTKTVERGKTRLAASLDRGAGFDRVVARHDAWIGRQYMGWERQWSHTVPR